MTSRRRADDPAVHGVLLVDKPAGPTSHDVVGWVRWVLGVRRVGHAGTLDPAATGLLVVAVGAATKLAPYLTGQDKGYRARIVLGASTTTGDAEGTVVETSACPADLEARLPAALAALATVQALPPPAFSAIHVDGQRAHVLARAGLAPALAERPMTVHALVPGPVARRGDRVDVDVELLVSKGTYVRSLAEALGRLLGVPAHLGALHRTRSGTLALDHPQAVTGIVAERVPTAPVEGVAIDRPPRWRLRLPAADAAPSGAEDPSDAPRAAATRLRARLLPPAAVVPMPVLRATPDDSGHRALARLAAGQALAWPDPGLPSALDAGASDPHVAVVPTEGPALVVARLERGPTGACLRPERVVVDPQGHP